MLFKSICAKIYVLAFIAANPGLLVQGQQNCGRPSKLRQIVFFLRIYLTTEPGTAAKDSRSKGPIIVLLRLLVTPLDALHTLGEVLCYAFEAGQDVAVGAEPLVVVVEDVVADFAHKEVPENWTFFLD